MRLAPALVCALLVLPPEAQADPVAAADVAAVNEALRTAVACTTRTGPEPAPACRALVEGSRERVGFPVLGERGHPSAWTPAMTLLRSDGSLLRLEGDPNRLFHGMVWVPEAGLYVGYAAWYGESGATLVFDPRGSELVRMVGTPVVSPDGGYLAAAAVDPSDDGALTMELFALGATGPKALARERRETGAMAVQAVAFVGTELLVGADLDAEPQLVRFDLSAHLPSASPDLRSMDACSKSETARYVTGDQVFLRSEPRASGPIEAALPWGTCVRSLGAFADWELVEVADRHGFVARRLAAPIPPVRTALPEELRGGFCSAGAPTTDVSDPAVRRALRANRKAGVEGYYARPFYDDYCLGLRPAEDDRIDLGRLERSDAESLEVRFATWTLALAPESAYRAHSHAEVLNESPLFRPVSATRHPSQDVEVQTPSGEAHGFHDLFGAPSGPAAPAPADVYLIPFSPDAAGLRFHGAQTFDSLGVAGSGFPDGRFRLSADKVEATFDRLLPAVVLDPCAGVFLPVALEVTYAPGAGRFGARIDEETRARLQSCSEGLPLEAVGSLRFLAVVDESAEAHLLTVLTRPPEAARSVGPAEEWAREWRWSLSPMRATLRTVTWHECGALHVSELEVHGEEPSYRLQSRLWDTGGC